MYEYQKSTLIRILTFVFILFMFSSFFMPLSADASHRVSTLRNKINALDDDRVDEIPIPILFGLTPQNLTRNFADPRSGGRSHEGLDLMAPKGAPIASPTPAVVTRVGVGDSAGKYVYTANPGGESMAYMHLDEFAEDLSEGDVLEAGDIIGYVGNTGNAISTSPHLHFELHDDGVPTDPFPRITRIFPLKTKIESLNDALNNADDAGALADYMVMHYRSDFLLAKTLAIALPDEIEERLSKVSNAIIPILINTAYMAVGSKGEAVVALQSFLIGKNIGSSASLVPDGNFGPKTQLALTQYQIASLISPANGVYGPSTSAYIAIHP